jgi:hypothetical protein
MNYTAYKLKNQQAAEIASLSFFFFFNRTRANLLILKKTQGESAA